MLPELEAARGGVLVITAVHEDALAPKHFDVKVLTGRFLPMLVAGPSATTADGERHASLAPNECRIHQVGTRALRSVSHRRHLLGFQSADLHHPAEKMAQLAITKPVARPIGLQHLASRLDPAIIGWVVEEEHQRRVHDGKHVVQFANFSRLHQPARFEALGAKVGRVVDHERELLLA